MTRTICIQIIDIAGLSTLNDIFILLLFGKVIVIRRQANLLELTGSVTICSYEDSCILYSSTCSSDRKHESIKLLVSTPQAILWNTVGCRYPLACLQISLDA
jgi:hypothetical protein